MALNSLAKEFGSEPVADFESMRNAIIQEVNTALTGSSVASDYRIKLELDNLKTSATPGQLRVAILNLMSALDARLEASTNVPYPWEEVRGEVKFRNSQERRAFFVRQTSGAKSATPAPAAAPTSAPTGRVKVPRSKVRILE